MKKASLQTLYNFLCEDTNCTDEICVIREEILAELNKDNARKAETAKGYEDAHDAIVGNLSDTPVTCRELYDAIKDELPEGFTQGKVQYALTHLWDSEIVKIDGKPNTYRRA